MAICETCGNDYRKTFNVKMDDQWYQFDCFECAIQKLAPRCQHCRCTIIGHGVEKDGDIYCCDHCRRADEMNLPNLETIAP